MAVVAAKANRTKATQVIEGEIPIYENMLFTIIRTATLEQTVESNAVVCIGADAYRSGIQAWKGINPSLEPKPRTIINIKAIEVPAPMEAPTPLHSDSICVPVTDEIKTKAHISSMPPMWAITKNSHLALSLFSPLERRKVVRVIISQVNKRTNTLSADIQEKHARKRAFSNALYLQPESDMDLTTCTTISIKITEDTEIIAAVS